MAAALPWRRPALQGVVDTPGGYGGTDRAEVQGNQAAAEWRGGAAKARGGLLRVWLRKVRHTLSPFGRFP